MSSSKKTTSTSNTIQPNEVASVVPMVQQTVTDCVVAAVAMLLGMSYADVFQAQTKTVKRMRKRGASSAADIQKLAKALGTKLAKRTEFDIDEDTGILVLLTHALVLFRGVIVDPSNGQLWSPDAYFKQHSGEPYEIECLLELA